VKYAWIVRHKALWPVTLACEVLGVSASGYFDHWRHKDTAKASRAGTSKRITGEALLIHIKAIHVEVKGEYGWPRMFKKLVARGIRVLMQRHGIKARGKRQEKVCHHHRQQTRFSHCAEERIDRRVLYPKLPVV
jgi:hypothetical protein